MRDGKVPYENDDIQSQEGDVERHGLSLQKVQQGPIHGPTDRGERIAHDTRDEVVPSPVGGGCEAKGIGCGNGDELNADQNNEDCAFEFEGELAEFVEHEIYWFWTSRFRARRMVWWVMPSSERISLERSVVVINRRSQAHEMRAMALSKVSTTVRLSP